MKVELARESYGKSQIRLTKVNRDGKRHDVVELSVDIDLSGDFNAAYTAGDNRLVIPTDTMKNTVYALARQHAVNQVELFAERLARHFLENFAHVDFARVEIVEHPWQPMEVFGHTHPHGFTGGTTERYSCLATATRGIGEQIELTQLTGLRGLQLMKTSESGFSGFLRDRYTTLVDTDDRIMATTLSADWTYGRQPKDFRLARERVRGALVESFAARFSPSVQATLHEMATAVFSLKQDTEADIDFLYLEMPNQHRLLVDLSPFGLDNPNEIFVPTEVPFGKISAEFVRESVGEE